MALFSVHVVQLASLLVLWQVVEHVIYVVTENRLGEHKRVDIDNKG